MQDINTHLRDELGLSELTILENESNELDIFNAGDIYDISKINNNFIKLYKRYYAENVDLDVKYEQVVNNMISFSNHLSSCSDRYTFIRRIKESLDLLRLADPILNYSSVKINNVSTPIDVQYQPILRTSIDDEVAVVKKHYDISSYFGSDSILQDIYEILPINIDEYGDVILTLRLKLHENTEFNIIRSQIYANKYSILNVEIIDNYSTVKSQDDLTIEKYKDYINIIVDDYVIADEITITLLLEQPSTSDSLDFVVLGIGKTRVGQISEWSYNNVSTLVVPYNKGVILSNFLYSNYSTSTIDGNSIYLPNISNDGIVRVNGMITMYSYGDNTFKIHPIPKQVTNEDEFLICVDEDNDVWVDANSSDNDEFLILGDMLYISSSAVIKYGLLISQDVKISYIPESTDISNWYTNDYIYDIQLYQYTPNCITIKSTTGDYWAGTLEQYANSRYISANDDGDLVEHISIPDGTQFEIETVEESVPGLCYRKYELYSDNRIVDITLDMFYKNGHMYMYDNWAMFGTINAILVFNGERFNVPVQSYFNLTTGEDYGFVDGLKTEGTPVKLAFNDKATEFFTNHPDTIIELYFQPFGTDEVVSNIQQEKTYEIDTSIVSGTIEYVSDSLILDPQIFNWEIQGNSYVHPKHLNVKYSPISLSSANLTSFTYEDSELMAKFDDSSLNGNITAYVYSPEVTITSSLTYDNITYVNTPLLYLEVSN